MGHARPSRWPGSEGACRWHLGRSRAVTSVQSFAAGFTDPHEGAPTWASAGRPRIGHVLGMTKHFGAPGGIFVPKPSLCLITLLRWAPELGATVRLQPPPVALQKSSPTLTCQTTVRPARGQVRQTPLFLRLSSAQSILQFEAIVLPPLDHGVMWSACISLISKCSVQTGQMPFCRSYASRF